MDFDEGLCGGWCWNGCGGVDVEGGGGASGVFDICEEEKGVSCVEFCVVGACGVWDFWIGGLVWTGILLADCTGRLTDCSHCRHFEQL